MVNDFFFCLSFSAFCAPCSVHKSRKEDLDGAMQPLHLFLSESILLLFLESHLWSFRKDHQEMRDIFDMVVWKVGVLWQELCLLALLIASITCISHSPRVSFCPPAAPFQSTSLCSTGCERVLCRQLCVDKCLVPSASFLHKSISIHAAACTC